VGDPPRRILVQIGDPGSEASAIADGFLDLCVGVADHNADLGDSCLDQVVQRIVENRLVGDWDQL